jgi:hypothetical protein
MPISFGGASRKCRPLSHVRVLRVIHLQTLAGQISAYRGPVDPWTRGPSDLLLKKREACANDDDAKRSARHWEK